MFIIRASHTEGLAFSADVADVRDYFADISNFIDLMPNIESIRTDEDGVSDWEITAQVPFVGSFTESFAVVQTVNSASRIEWIPYDPEHQNLLSFVSVFEQLNEDSTDVQFTQTIELRRRSATSLHLFAGLAGEALISTEMEKHVAAMMREFLIDSKERIES